MSAPYSQKLQAKVIATATGADAEVSMGEAPFAGTLTDASYTPDATITGVDTNSRTISIINKGASGTGTTSMASLALTNGVNATGYDEKPLTLSATPANLVVAKGDIISYKSLHIGTGLADPGGLVQVELTASYA